MKVYNYSNDYAAQEKAKQQKVAPIEKEVEHVKDEPETVTSGIDEVGNGGEEKETVAEQGEGDKKAQKAGGKKKK